MKLLFVMILSFVLGACAGSKGDKGDVGLTGAQGQTGQTGSSGRNGQDGNEVTPVKLCPGTSSYPSTFVEYGLCINGSLYAVYSANGGFLALLPNGAYQSNAIGSRCNLFVSGCEVSH